MPKVFVDPIPSHPKVRGDRTSGSPAGQLCAESNPPPKLMDREETCRYFGGSKPINASTLYRGVKSGRFPKPVKIGPGSSRWILWECEKVLELMMAERN
jgi:predicted DNA-binding transcriptional regulator AlpA